MKELQVGYGTANMCHDFEALEEAEDFKKMFLKHYTGDANDLTDKYIVSCDFKKEINCE